MIQLYLKNGLTMKVFHIDPCSEIFINGEKFSVQVINSIFICEHLKWVQF